MASTVTKIDPIKLQEALSHKKGTPLLSIAPSQDGDAFFSKGIYRFAPGIYMSFSELLPKTFEKNPLGPCLTSLLIAPDDSAVSRVVKMDIENDAQIQLDVPAAILPKGAVGTYGSILQGLKSENGHGSLESAIYRIAVDGKFVHRTIQTSKYDFYFRGLSDDDKEAPYAIGYKLD